MKHAFKTTLFFILLIAACATSPSDEESTTTEAEDIEQELTVDDMIKRDQEKADSLKEELLKLSDED